MKNKSFAVVNTVFLLILLFSWNPGQLSAQFTLTGELRPRTELRHGYKTLPDDGAEAAFFTEQRSRLILDYESDLYEVRFSIQDVRIWGSQSQLNKSDGLFSVHEAWGQVDFSEVLSLKAGRQELVYDDQRILGSVGWTAQGRSHDAMVLKFASEEWDIHTGFAFNQDNNPPEPAKLFDTFYSGVNNYKTLQYVWYQRAYDTGGFSFLFLNNGVQLPDSTVNFTQTLGLSGTKNISDVLIGAAVFYQTGTDPGDNDLSAWLASIYSTYSGFEGAQWTLGGDYLSGTGVGQSDNHSFNPLYGTHHKFYGLMDYFYVGNPHDQPAATHSNSTGLVDFYLKSGFTLTSRSTLTAAIHEFFSPVTIVDPGDPSADVTARLGTEIDVTLGHRVSDGVTIQAGYSHLFGTDSLEIIKGGDRAELASWAWVMLSMNPVFLSD